MSLMDGRKWFKKKKRKKRKKMKMKKKSSVRLCKRHNFLFLQTEVMCCRQDHVKLKGVVNVRVACVGRRKKEREKEGERERIVSGN